MPSKLLKNQVIEYLSLKEKKNSGECTHHVIDNLDFFYSSFMLDGNVDNLLGLEALPHTIDAAGLCICLEGSGEVIVDAQSYPIRKGDMCVVFPNSILQICNKSVDFKGYTVACTQEFLMSVNVPSSTALYLYIKENPCISLSHEEQDGVIRMCDFLKAHDTQKDHPCREEIAKHLASAIVYEVVGIYKRNQPKQQIAYSRKNQLYFAFMQLLTKQCKTHKSVAYYANSLFITPRYLSSICKEFTGLTATACINRQLIIHARILLSSTDQTILQVSEELNFPNPSFFSQFFKKHTGVTPKRFKEK